jgi:hypothetical protein
MRFTKLICLAATAAALPISGARAEPPTPAGVWIGVKNTGGFDAQGRFQLAKSGIRFRTFLANGASFEGLPLEGLTGLDLAAARRHPQSGAFWGVWTLAGDTVVARQPSGRAQAYHLDGDTLREDRATTGSAVYWRMQSLDGARLAGTYSTFVKWDASQAGSTWRTRPLITFAADGTFADEGIVMPSVLDDPARSETRPGRGKYQVAAYTLILAYDDGRVVRRAFAGPPRGAETEVLYLVQTPIYRVK